MDGMANPEEYGQAITALRGIRNQLESACSAMEQAGRTCVDSMNGDNTAERASARLTECTHKIRDQYEQIEGLIRALEAEKERAIGIIAQGNQI